MLAIAAKTFHRRALCLHCKYLQVVTVIYRETLQSLCRSEQELWLKSALQHCIGVVKNVNHAAAAPVRTFVYHYIIEKTCKCTSENPIFFTWNRKNPNYNYMQIQGIPVIIVGIAFAVYILLLDGIRLS